MIPAAKFRVGRDNGDEAVQKHGNPGNGYEASFAG